MSLFDGIAPLDSLLEGIVKSEVFVALRKDLKDDPNRFGAGTAEDPYDGSKTSGGFYKFDYVMRERVPANSTVRLGPGVFPSLGYKSDNSGWTAKSGCRLVGGGWSGPNGNDYGVTVIKLDAQADADAVAVGSGTSSYLLGFELSHVLIDCNFLQGANCAAAAINLNGKHIYVHHVRIIKFGAEGAGVCNVVTLAKPAPGKDVYNCVLADSVIEEPVIPASQGIVTCVRLSGVAGENHRLCGIRNNVIDGGNSANNISAFAVHGAHGTIIEQNRVWRCKRGLIGETGSSGQTSVPSKDIILRDNYLYDVQTGVLYDVTGSAVIGRLVLEANELDLPTSGSPVGFKLTGTATNPRTFGQVIVRKNLLRHLDAANGTSGTAGMVLEAVSQGIVEENVMDLGDTASLVALNGITMNGNSTIKTFNNHRSNGRFIPCVGPNGQAPDLVNEAQDWLLAS